MKLFLIALIGLTSLFSHAGDIEKQECSLAVTNISRRELRDLKGDVYNGYKIVKSKADFEISVISTSEICGYKGGSLFLEYRIDLAHSSGFKKSYKYCNNYLIHPAINEIAPKNRTILEEAEKAMNVKDYQSIMSEYKKDLDIYLPAQYAKNHIEKALYQIPSCETLLGLDDKP